MGRVIYGLNISGCAQNLQCEVSLVRAVSVTGHEALVEWPGAGDLSAGVVADAEGVGGRRPRSGIHTGNELTFVLFAIEMRGNLCTPCQMNANS